MLLIATKLPAASRPVCTAAVTRCTNAKYPARSATGRSTSVTTCDRGTTRTCPGNTGRVSRNATPAGSEATVKAGTEPATMPQNTQSATREKISLMTMTYGFDTLAIHAGQDPDPRTGAVVPPIYQTSTYAQDAVGEPRLGYEYSRTDNPTRSALQECLAALEGGRRGLAFASGMAAEDALLRTVCRPGDHVVIPNDAYGGTFRLFARIAQNWGLHFDIADLSDVDDARAKTREGTRIIWVETPTNPLLNIADIAGLAQLAHDRGALLVVDNTFASPYLQQPLALGADAVVHSTTKYLGGHSDVVGGAIVTSLPEMHERLAFLQNSVGAVPGPLDCFLVLRGLKTLAVRMEAHCRNAQGVAEFLAQHPRVRHVYYPGLPSHPGHDLAAAQMDGFGGMVSFETETEREALDIC